MKCNCHFFLQAPVHPAHAPLFIEISAHAGPVVAIKLSPLNNTLISVAADGSIFILAIVVDDANKSKTTQPGVGTFRFGLKCCWLLIYSHSLMLTICTNQMSLHSTRMLCSCPPKISMSTSTRSSSCKKCWTKPGKQWTWHLSHTNKKFDSFNFSFAELNIFVYELKLVVILGRKMTFKIGSWRPNIVKVPASWKRCMIWLWAKRRTSSRSSGSFLTREFESWWILLRTKNLITSR